MTLRICVNCGIIEEKLQKCSKCQKVRYCGKACQTIDWKRHKVEDCDTFLTATLDTDLCNAITKHKINRVRALILYGAETNQRFEAVGFPLVHAAKNGQLEIVKALLYQYKTEIAKDRNINESIVLALKEAIKKGHKEIKDCLINFICYGNREFINCMIDYVLKRNNDTILINELAQSQNTDILSALLDNGIPVIVTSNSETSPPPSVFLGAGYQGNNINAKASQKRTMLHGAVQDGNLDVVKTLLNMGADVGAKDYRGDTPLHIAVCNGHLDIATLLIENGADVNARNNLPGTPLHFAVGANNLEIVRLLLDKGADVDAKIDGIATPLRMAMQRGFMEIAQLLIQKGADNQGKK